MKDYKVESYYYESGYAMNCRTKPRYFQTREKADKYADTLLSAHQCYVLGIYILHRDRQGIWSTVRYIEKSSSYCVVSDYPE